MLEWIDTPSFEESPSMVSDCHISDTIIEVLKGLKDTYAHPSKSTDFPKERYFPPNQERINLSLHKL